MALDRNGPRSTARNPPARLKPNLGALRFWDGVEAERGKLPLYPAAPTALGGPDCRLLRPPCEVRLGGPDRTPP